MADPTSPPGDHVFDPGDMAALPYQTNIDRRHATRTVPMVVLCLGQSRTGTVSLRQALVKLGYKDCYHYSSVMQENPRDAGLWIEALNAKFKGDGKPYGKDEWDALLGHCQAVTDTPCVLFYKELLAAYPDAKVILTERDDADQWFRSQMSTVVPYAVMALPETWLDRVKQMFSPVDKTPVRLSEVIIKQTPVYRALWHDLRHGTSTAKQVYEDYNAEIKRIVPEENLLVFNVKEGWEPLCNFLGHDVPDEAFPRRNDRAAFEKNQQKFGAFVQAASSRNMMVVGAGMAVLVGMVAIATMRRA